jgi:CPA1 family monovalent cation:H+ antiporter
MTYFESILVLLLLAIVLLQFSKQLSLPYPSLLVVAGIVVALVPGTPAIHLDPGTALALFIAPAILDAAFDFPLGTARHFWAPLVVFAVVAVIITTAIVAVIGVEMAGLPIAAALVLGAIVSPPDAAATTATLGTVSIPKAIDAILKGESLFNDATALLIFAGALAIQSNHGLDTKIVLEVVGAVPGGILFGAACALLYRWTGAPFMQSLRGSLLQFVSTYLVWIIAERLQISAVLAEVTYAMVLARNVAINTSPRNRVHSYAVWSSVVFVLNVLAFLLMGMQARVIIERTQSDLLGREFQFAGVVVAAAILTRLVVIIGSNHVAAWILRRAGQSPRGTWHQGVFAGWAGMRGLVTLATAFALPDSFPKRDLVVLTAFSVVIATLVVQGFTLAPLVRWLGLDQTGEAEKERLQAREALAKAALKRLETEAGREAESLRIGYLIELESALALEPSASLERRQQLGLAAVAAERAQLEALRDQQLLDAQAFERLLEDIDFRALSLLPEADRRIEKN